MEPENLKNVIDIVLTVNKYKLKENNHVIFDLNKGDKVAFNATLRDIGHLHMHLVDIKKIPGHKDLPDVFHTHSRFTEENEAPKVRLFQNDNTLKPDNTKSLDQDKSSLEKVDSINQNKDEQNLEKPANLSNNNTNSETLDKKDKVQKNLGKPKLSKSNKEKPKSNSKLETDKK